MPTPARPCLQQEEGREIAERFQALIREYSADSADRLLAPDVVAYCDGMNALAGKPLGGPTYSSRDELKAELERNMAHPTPVTLQAIDAVTCDTVVLRWTATFGEARLPVRGIQVLTVERKQHKDQGVDNDRSQSELSVWVIKTVDTEFNSLAYLVNLGGTFNLTPTR